MKLDVTAFRYITKDEFRVLTAVEMGMRNHELVPAPLIESIAKITRGGCYKLLQSLLRHKLVAHDGKKYDGYRLTYHGYDFLAIRALAMRGSIASVGRRLGVGKESDVHYAQGPNGELLAMKLHRLGRISFRAIKSKRDYLKGREHASWMYMARLAAMKEFAYMKALGDEGFPVPTPVDQNRHVVVMTFVRATPLYNIRSLNRPHQVLERLMRLLVRLARAGVVHGDFNEFNLMIDDEEKVTLIDFPQLIHTTHTNAEDIFDRDVLGVREFFRKRLNIEVETWPTWEEVISGAPSAEVEAVEPVSTSAALLRTGNLEGLGAEENDMLVAAHDQGREAGDDPENHGEDEEEEGEEGEEDEAEEGAAVESGEGCKRQGDEAHFQRVLDEGVEDGDECNQEVLASPDCANAEAEDAEESDEQSDDSEVSDRPGQVAIPSKKRVRNRTNAKEARKNIQRQQKQRPAKANTQKSREMRRAKNEVKEWMS